MASRRGTAPGIIETYVTEAGNVFTVQRQRNGQTVYRKNGRFTKKRAFTSAKARPQSRPILGSVRRAPGLFEERTSDSDWIRPNGTAGDLAHQILPELQPGDELTDEQSRILKNERRLDHSFWGFWHSGPNMDLSREEVEREFTAFIRAVREAQTAFERDQIRMEFGLNAYESMDALTAA